jgi:hypothetical protein
MNINSFSFSVRRLDSLFVYTSVIDIVEATSSISIVTDYFLSGARPLRVGQSNKRGKAMRIRRPM